MDLEEFEATKTTLLTDEDDEDDEADSALGAGFAAPAESTPAKSPEFRTFYPRGPPDPRRVGSNLDLRRDEEYLMTITPSHHQVKSH